MKAFPKVQLKYLHKYTGKVEDPRRGDEDAPVSVLIGAYRDDANICQLQVQGEGTPSFIHAGTISADDYLDVPTDFGADEVVWQGGRVTGAIGSRVVHATKPDGISRIVPEPLILVDTTVTMAYAEANFDNDACAMLLEILPQDGDMIEDFLSWLTDTFTLTDGDANTVTHTGVPDAINVVSLVWHAEDAVMAINVNEDWSADTLYGGVMLAGGPVSILYNLIISGRIRNIRTYVGGSVLQLKLRMDILQALLAAGVALNPDGTPMLNPDGSPVINP